MSHENELNFVDKKFQKLPHKIYEDNLRKVIKKLLKISSDEYKIKYSAGSSRGDNYIGIIYRAQVIHENDVKLSIIVKLPPENKARREEFFLHRSFMHEADFYENLYPIYKNFQRSNNITVEIDGFYEIPLCHKAITEEPFEGLYFEDLKMKNFEIFSRTEDLTRQHVILVMKVLAKMHATFYCIKEQNPSVIEPYITRNDYFIMRCERKGSLMNSWYENSKNQALEVIDKCGNEELVQKVHALLSQDITTLFKRCLNLKITEPYATLCHGDVI